MKADMVQMAQCIVIKNVLFCYHKNNRSTAALLAVEQQNMFTFHVIATRCRANVKRMQQFLQYFYY